MSGAPAAAGEPPAAADCELEAGDAELVGPRPLRLARTEERGRCLHAAIPFAAGARILGEDPFVALRCRGGPRRGPCCGHCLRPLAPLSVWLEDAAAAAADAEGQAAGSDAAAALRRAAAAAGRFDDGFGPPGLCGATAARRLLPAPTPCGGGCGEQWCGEQCAAAARRAGHLLHCEAVAAAAAGGGGTEARAAAEYADTFGGNERFALLLRLVARLAALCDARTAAAGESGCSAACTEALEQYADGDLQAVRLGGDGRRALARCRQLLGQMMPHAAAAHRALFSAQALVRALNVFDCNCHTAFALSPVYALLRHVRCARAAAAVGRSGSAADSEAAAAARDALAMLVSMPHPARLHVPAVAMYRTAACLNHSCRPNCKLRPPPGAVRAEVFSLGPVAAGEELTVSYVDETALAGLPFSRRALLAPYGFLCCCPACEEEAAVHAAAWAAAAVALLSCAWAAG